MLWLWVLCSEIVGILHTAGGSVRGSILVDTRTVQTISVHRISGIPDTSIPAGAPLKVSFPSAYKSLPQGTVTCQAGDDSPTPPTPSSCSISSQVLTVTWATPISSNSLFSFKLSLPNPMAAATLSTYQMITYASEGGSMLDQQTSGLSVTFNPCED